MVVLVLFSPVIKVYSCGSPLALVVDGVVSTSETPFSVVEVT
jgi:hypothetical protein